MAASTSGQVIWDGGAGTGAWGTGTNWSTNAVPATTASLQFDAANANSQYAITLGANRTAASLTFVSAVGTNAFTFSGANTLTVNAGGITNNDADTQTFSSTVIVNSAQTWNAASGDLTFNAVNFNNTLTLSGAGTIQIGSAGGALTLNNNRTLTNNTTANIGAISLSNRTLTAGGTGTTNVTGVISGTGALIKTGTGTLSLSGANTYTGTNTVSQGTLQIDANAPSGSAGALGNATSTITVNNASTGANDTALLIGTDGVTVGRTVTVANSGSGVTTVGGNIATGTGTFSGAVTMNRATSLNADGDSNITFSGVVGGSGAMTKTGTGTVTLSGANTYTGATTISEGTLQINANAPSGSAGALGNATSTVTLNNAGTGASDTALLIGASGVTIGRTVTVANSGSGATTLGGNIASGTGTFSGAVTLNKAASLAAEGTSNITFSGAIGGTGAVTKTGAGTVTLSGNNTFAGGTTLSTGTLAVGHNSALGSGTLTINAGTLAASGAPRTLSNAVTLGGNFAIGGSQDLTLSGNIDLGGGTRTITVDNTGTTTFSGIIGEPWYSGFDKAGNGRLVLSGANTFTGTVAVSDGTLALTNNNSLGAAATWGNVVANGATLEFSNNISVSEGGFTITGTGDAGAGAINNLSGTNSLAGQLVLGGATTINSAAGSLTLSSYTDLAGYGLTTSGAGDLTFSGQLNGSGSTVTKSGTGTLTLSGNNSYTGATTISGGTLVAANATALGTSGSGTTVATGATLALQGGINIAAESITVTGTGDGGLGAVRNISGANTIGSTLALSGDTTIGSTAGTLTLAGISGTNRSLIFAGAGDTTVSGAIATGSGTLTKQDAGTLTLSTANTFTGTTTVSGGTLNLRNANSLGLGAGTVTVASGATLQQQGGFNVSGRNLSLGGTLESVSGANTWGNNLTLSGSASIVSSASGVEFNIGDSFSRTITMGANTLTFDGAGDTRVNSFLGQSGDTGSIVKNGTGTLTLYGDRNYYTGTTTVNEGTLILDTADDIYAPDVTILGNLVIGDGTGSATVRYGNATSTNNKIVNTANVTINADGTLDLNGRTDTVNGLTMTAGTVTLGVTGNLTILGNVTTNAASVASTISGYQFALSSDNATLRTFTVADGAAASDLTINAQVAFGGIVKEGTGRMTLTGSNIYGATTSVNAGILTLTNSNALGAHGSGAPASGTTVASNAALELDGTSGNLAVGAESLTLSGVGFNGVATGALRNLAGDNSWAGGITLAAAARINSDSGTLTINGGISAASQNLTVGGVGNTTINGVIGTGSGTLTKDGSGTLILTGDNTYAGATTVSAGVLNIREGDALGSTLAGTTVQTGAALQMQNNISVGAETLSLSGTGVSNDGALRNISGNNTFGGAITVASASARINSDSGTLTLSNTVALGTNTLTVGGAGNTTLTGQLTGAPASNLNKDGAGTLTLSNSTNTFSGNVDVSGGTLAFGANNALNSSSIDVTVGTGATMSLVAYAQTIGTLAGVGAIDFGTSGSLTLMGDSTFSGSFTGTGEIIVAAGVTLHLGADFNASGVTITLAGGTLDVNGSNSVFAALNLTGNSVIDFDSAANSTVQFTNLSLGSYSLAVTGWVDTQDYFLATNSPGTQGSPPLNQVTFAPSGPWTGANTTWQSWDKQVTPVPEPSTYGALLMAAGLLGFGYRRWHQAAKR